MQLPLAAAPANSDGRPAVYGIRPEHFTIADDGAEAEIVVVEPTGSETQVFAKLGGEEIVAVFRERHKFEPGDKVRLQARSDAGASVRRGDRQAIERVTSACAFTGSDGRRPEQAGDKNRRQDIKPTSQGRNYQ